MKYIDNFDTKKVSRNLKIILLARAVGVQVGQRSGGRLATTLLATIKVIIFNSPHPHYSNGPDDVGHWHRATFVHVFQGTSIGLAVTNHALLSLVDTNLAKLIGDALGELGKVDDPP